MPQVKIYSTPTCAYCKMAKEYFKEKNIEYEESNVADDAEQRQKMFEQSGQMGVPVIEVNGKIMVGFDRDKFEKLMAEGN